MIKTLKYSFATLFLLIAGSYLISTSQKDFFDMYQKQDNHSESLKEFQSRPVNKIIVNETEWLYYSGGKGTKTILFLHGMGGAYDLWWQQINAFENEYNIITYSLPEDVKSLEEASKGILAILKKEEVTHFYAVGTSMGGYIAQYLLETIPERVDKIVFGNTFPPNDYILNKNIGKSKVIPLLPEVLISYFGNKQLKNKILPAAKNDALLTAFLPSLPFSKKQFVNRFSVVVDKFDTHSHQFDKARIPKLIIESDNDPLVDLMPREALKKAHQDAKVFTFRGEGHFPYINVADKYNEVLKTFFDKENEYLEVENVLAGYFKGRKNANIDLLRNVFSSDAMLFTSDGEKEFIIPFEAYLEKVSSDGKQEVETTILDAEILGKMARFSTKFKYKDKTYIDFLTLLKTNDQWKIISKTFEKL